MVRIIVALVMVFGLGVWFGWRIHKVGTEFEEEADRMLGSGDDGEETDDREG